MRKPEWRLHDALSGVEAETEAAADGLGGEEGFEDAGQDGGS